MTSEGHPRGIFGRVERGEWRLFLASAGYFFCLLGAYYILRPVRETAGIRGKENVLHLLFLATFIVMLVAVPVYGALVARIPRTRFIAGSTCVFALQLLILVGCFRAFPEWRTEIGRVFFVWLSVFNLYVVSIFWSLMVERWSLEAGKRLFGPIMAGGSAGALVGSQITARLSHRWHPEQLMLLSAMILLVTVFFLAVIARGAVRAENRPVGGSVLAGLSTIARSPYLQRAATYLFILTLCGTTVYLSKNELIRTLVSSESDRQALFANIDTLTTSLTFLLQLVGVSLFLRHAGVGPTLSILPVIYLVGFIGFAFVPILGSVVLFEILRRGVGYGVASPSREVLFTVVPTEEKYKSKAFIDTVVYRGGDMIAAQIFAALAKVLSIAWIAGLAAPLCALWIGVALYLGRDVSARAKERRSGDGAMTPPGESAGG